MLALARTRQTAAIIPFPRMNYDAALLHEWLLHWAWYMNQGGGARGWSAKVPGLNSGAGAKVATAEDADIIYDEADEDRAKVIKVIVYEELAFPQRMAVEHEYLNSVYRMRELARHLDEGRKEIAKRLRARGFAI